MSIPENERAELIRRIVGEVASKTLRPPDPGPRPAPPAPSVEPSVPRPARVAAPAVGWTAAKNPPLVTGEELRDLPPGSIYRVPKGSLLTPLARDVAADRRIAFVSEEEGAPAAATAASPWGLWLALGADHAGFRLKEALAPHLRSLGYEVRDFGTAGEAPVDYPDFARAVAEAVASGEFAFGIVVDGAGIGAAIAANKVPGIRAAPCPDAATARNAREHNFANVLCLPARSIDETRAREVVVAFLGTQTGGERHARRVAKIGGIERAYLRSAAGPAVASPPQRRPGGD